MTDEADLSALLRGFGPDAPVDTAMPDDVWARVQATLRAESAARAGSTAAQYPAAPVEPSGDELAARRNSRRRHSRRWATGLVAASAVVLAGVVVTSVTHSGDPTPLATSVALGQPEAMASAGLFAAPAASQALAAQRVTHSNTDYSLVGLGTQVTDLMQQAGVPLPGLEPGAAAKSADIPAVALPPAADTSDTYASGVSALLVEPIQRLQECLADVANSAGATALVVDLSTFDGQPAGIVVSPSRDGRMIIVDVVNLDCSPAMIAEIPMDAQPGMMPRLLP